MVAWRGARSSQLPVWCVRHARALSLFCRVWCVCVPACTCMRACVLVRHRMCAQPDLCALWREMATTVHARDSLVVVRARAM